MSDATGVGRRPRRTWSQRLMLVTNFVLILVCLVSATSLELAWSKARQIRRVSVGQALDAPISADGLGEPVADDGAQNYLVVGVDSAEGLDPNDPVRLGRDNGLRSDTIMVLRVDPKASEAQLLSFPRDLWVPIAGSGGGSGGKAKINSAIQSGSSQLIATIKNDFGIPINHYIQIDFAGFQSIVDAVGGVPVDFPNPVRDKHSLLPETGPGCITLTGGDALAYARSRYFETKVDGKWRSDPTADLGRIDRQQEFIKLVIQRAIQKGARDPRVLQDLLAGGLQSVKVDERLTVRQILDLAGKFKAFSGDQLATYEVPSASSTVGGASVQLVLAAQAQPVLDLFRGVEPASDNDPRSTIVQVHNGTPEAGKGAEAGGELRSRGFILPDEFVADYNRFDVGQTVVKYNPGQEARGQLVASYLKGPYVLQPEALYAADVDVVVGADWQGVLDQPSPAATGPPAIDTSTSTGAPATTTTSAPPALPTPSTVPESRAVFVPTGC